jgi:MFS family permease
VKTEARLVNIAGAAQGVALVTFPAASTIFTSPSHYALTPSAYGTMFVPQAIAAIAASLFGARWAGRVGTRRVYLIGLCANFAAMALLVVSDVTINNRAVTFAILLLATASLGIGFGLTVPSLNTFAAAFNPNRVDASVLTLNALLGLGTALAPVLVAIFVGLRFWWGLPVLTAAALAAILVASVRLPFRAQGSAASAAEPRARIPPRFFVYAAFAVGYGFCETMNGNWASLDMKQLGASTTEASLALTTFWACVTLGRVGVALIQRRFPTRRAYHVLPFVLAVAFVLISELSRGRSSLGIVTFGLAGLGCSALLPLTISFGQKELVAMSTAVAGGIIAFYQAGYGLAAFGAGPLQKAGIELSTLYRSSALIALALGALAFSITRPHREHVAVHPQPAAHVS